MFESPNLQEGMTKAGARPTAFKASASAHRVELVKCGPADSCFVKPASASRPIRDRRDMTAIETASEAACQARNDSRFLFAFLAVDFLRWTIGQPPFMAAGNVGENIMNDEGCCSASARMGFFIHLAAYLVVNAALLFINLATNPGRLWFQWPLLGWGLGVMAHALAVFVLPRFNKRDSNGRVPHSR